MQPIFIAGPHGSGKTTLIKTLSEKSKKFIVDDFKIDFSNEMETLSVMTIFEKCLIRLYHRFYTAQLALQKCNDNKEEKFLLIDRSIYDSLVYINVEYQLGELNEEQYIKLKEIGKNGIRMIEPYTVILNPNPKEIISRLSKRREMGIRKKRDILCKREDNIHYIEMMNSEFVKIYGNKNVIHVHDNKDEDIELIYKWIDDCVLAKDKS